MGILSKQLISNSSNIAIALLRNQSYLVVPKPISKSLTTGFGLSAATKETETIRIGLKRCPSETFQQCNESSQSSQSQQFKKPQSQLDCKGKNENKNAKKPLILVPIKYLEEPGIDTDQLIKAAKALQTQAECEAGKLKDSTNFAIVVPIQDKKKQSNKCAPPKKDNCPSDKKQQDSCAKKSLIPPCLSKESECDQQPQSGDPCGSQGSNSSKDSKCDQKPASSQPCDKQKSSTSKGSHCLIHPSKDNKNDAIQAYIICSEDGSSDDCGSDDKKRDENKVKLQLNEKIVQQLECLNITGMNLNFVMDIPNISAVIQRMEKCKALAAAKKCPPPPPNPNPQTMPFNMGAKITGTLDFDLQKLKESKLIPQELNSRISSVASSICLVALESGAASQQEQNNEDDCKKCDEPNLSEKQTGRNCPPPNPLKSSASKN